MGLPEAFVAVGADMPPESSDRTQIYTPAGLRELAARSRRLAQELIDEAEANRFIGIAEEMEAKAAALEARTQTQSEAQSRVSASL